MSRKVIIIDGRGHLLGRLASVIAKELLKGQHVVVVRCEDINISGSLYRNKLKYQRFLRLRMNSNPSKGPFHLRAPSKILWRTIRGMIPHKTTRGAIALSRFRGFEGIPHPYDKTKRMVVLAALKVIRLKPGRDYCRLGDMSKKVGWSHDALIKRLEDKRKVRAESRYKVSKELTKLKLKAKEEANKHMTADEMKFLQMYNKA